MTKPSIAIIDIVGLPYDGTTLEKRGLGGSESAAIYLTRELALLDFDVTVFCRCNEDINRPGVYDGVRFRPIEEATSTADTFDIVISSRTVQPFMEGDPYWNLPSRARWRMLWMHDTFLWGDNEMERLVVSGRINEIITLSDWHTSYVLTCDHGKRRNYEMLKSHTYVMRNGMGKYIDEVDITAKDPDQFVYNASVSKGMVVLFEKVWPRIRQEIPNAKLKIIGGFYTFPEADGLDEQGRTCVALQKEHHGHNGVEFTGVIPQREIAEILAGATWFLYPTAFPETFGISTLEAQAYNCVPLTTRFGALEEVAMDTTSFKLDYTITPNALFPGIDTDSQVDKFVDMVLAAYRNPYLKQQKQHAGNALKDIMTWDTIAVQFKQHIFRKLGWYLPVEEHRRAAWISNRVKQLYGRRMGNEEEHVEPKASVEKPIYVISPFRNCEQYLEEHITSVAAQNYDNWHHILIDDYSTDSSADVIRDVISRMGDDYQSRYTVIHNTERKGAVGNQIESIRRYVSDPDAIVVLLDGDDFLVNHPDVFDKINNLHHEGKEFTYGSCWSMADSIPLVAQAYPRSVRQNKTYRAHKFNWGIPYTHLRTFRKGLIDNIPDRVFQDNDGIWFTAGGDVATFYNIIEQVKDPDAVHAVTDILVKYNDINPANDYKVHGTEQNRNAAIIAQQKPIATHKETTKMSTVTNTKKKRILLAIPTARNIEVDTFKSIYDLDVPDEYEVDFQYFYGYNIAQIRNLIADWTVRNQYDYLFAVDSDMVLPKDTLRKLLAADKDVISGLYIQRIPNTHTVEIYGVTQGGGRANIPYEQLRGLGVVEVAGCGFGCVLIKRKVFEGVPYPQFEYHNALNHQNTVSEDVDFCMKATNNGFTIWADTSIKCDHVGSFVYRVKD